MATDVKTPALYVFIIHEDEQSQMKLLRDMKLQPARDDHALIIFCSNEYKSFEVGYLSFAGKKSGLTLLGNDDSETVKKALSHPTGENLKVFQEGVDKIKFFVYDNCYESHIYIANVYSYINSSLISDFKTLGDIDKALLSYAEYSKDKIYSANEEGKMSLIEYVNVTEDSIVSQKVKHIKTKEVFDLYGVSIVGAAYSIDDMAEDSDYTKPFLTRFVNSDIDTEHNVFIDAEGRDVKIIEEDDDDESVEKNPEDEEPVEEPKLPDQEETKDLASEASADKDIVNQIVVDENPSKRRRFEEIISVDKDVDLNESSTPLKIVQMLVDVSLATQYNGFSASLIRSRFARDCGADDAKIFARNLCLAFTAYSRTGNNIAKLGNKRENSKVSKEVMNIISKLKIKKKAKEQSDTTLPRIAIAFMPEYLVYRKSIAQKLQSQTSSSIPVEYQDIVFAGFSGMNGIDGYEKFHTEFSSFIYNPKEPTALDDKKFLKDLSKWKNISVKGYAADKDMFARMQHAHNTEFIDKESAFNWLSTAFSDEKYIK